MRNFVARALNKLNKLDKDQVRALIMDLATENDLLEMVLDSLTDGLVVIDQEDRVIFLNKAAQKQMPFFPGDPREKKVVDVFSDPDVANFVAQNLGLGVDVTDREFSYGTGAAGTRTLSYSIMPLTKDKEIRGKVLHIEDVTLKRQEEARLRRAESLASLTTLAAGVAHEIKNPLGSMGIHIQLLQRALANQEKLDREAMLENLDIVSEEVERLNGIVVDFLFAVRPMDIHPKICCLNERLEDVISFIKFELEERNIEIRKKLTSIPCVSLDDKYIKQALLNLIKNAEAAMEGGGRLTFSTWEEGGSVYLSVEDNGSGINEENLSKIFEPYFTTKDFGSGLGLTLVYKIIKEHRGDITVKSKKNKGTTFTFRFPIPQKDQRLLEGGTSEV